MRPPAVSVIMPVYNAAPFLTAAVESVLAQTFEDFELIAVDDGSTDASAELLQAVADRRLRVVRRAHGGVAAAMNAGLALCRGALVARADADDRCLPDRLARQVAWCRAHPEVALVGGALRVGRRVLRYPPDALRIRWTMLYASPVANPTLMVRRAAAEAVGGWPVDHPVLDDYPFVSRVAARWAAANLPEVLVVKREHPGALSARRRAEQVAEGDRVRRANVEALVGPGPDAARLVDVLAARPGARALGAAEVRALLERLVAAFRARWGVDDAAWARLRPWVAGELLERARLHGRRAPAARAALVAVAWRLAPGLVARPRAARTLARHLLLACLGC